MSRHGKGMAAAIGRARGGRAGPDVASRDVHSTLTMAPQIPRLTFAALRSGTHGTITAAFGATLAEAASVCFEDRSHASPTSIVVRGATIDKATIEWEPPTDQAKRCWGDPQVTTEHGAYGVAALLVPACLDLQIVERSKKGPGFDFWLGSVDDGSALFQRRARLEVAGLRTATPAALGAKVSQKVKQTMKSDGALPAVVIVVEFGSPQAQVIQR